MLIGGRRFPLAGTVCMDNITVDVGRDPTCAAATTRPDRRQGGRSAEEVARRIGTINYEVTTGLTARVPRVYHRDGESPGEA